MQKAVLEKRLSLTMLGAMAFILMLFSFPIIPAFPYLKMDLSDVVVTIATFVYGPIGGIVTAALKATLDFLIKGANLMTLVGDVAAFLASISFALPIYYVKKNNSSKIRLFLGLILAIFSLTLVMTVLNYFVLTPLYVAFSGFKLTGTLLNYVVMVIVPFNLVKGVVLSLISGFLLITMVPWLQHYVARHL